MLQVWRSQGRGAALTSSIVSIYPCCRWPLSRLRLYWTVRRNARSSSSSPTETSSTWTQSLGSSSRWSVRDWRSVVCLSCVPRRKCVSMVEQMLSICEVVCSVVTTDGNYVPYLSLAISLSLSLTISLSLSLFPPSLSLFRYIFMSLRDLSISLSLFFSHSLIFLSLSLYLYIPISLPFSKSDWQHTYTFFIMYTYHRCSEDYT